MSSVATVIAVFGVVLVIGLVLRQRSERRLAELAATEEDAPDPRDLADPSRWPAPPPEPSDDTPDAAPEAPR